jgi:hypothetical protein
MHDGFGGVAFIGPLIFIIILVVSFCIAIAPLFIWRNGNRTNRLLALIAINQGISADQVREVFYSGGSELPKEIKNKSQDFEMS